MTPLTTWTLFYIFSERMRQLLHQNGPPVDPPDYLSANFMMLFNVLHFYQGYRVLEQSLTLLFPAEENHTLLGFARQVRLHML